MARIWIHLREESFSWAIRGWRSPFSSHSFDCNSPRDFLELLSSFTAKLHAFTSTLLIAHANEICNLWFLLFVAFLSSSSCIHSWARVAYVTSFFSLIPPLVMVWMQLRKVGEWVRWSKCRQKKVRWMLKTVSSWMLFREMRSVLSTTCSNAFHMWLNDVDCLIWQKREAKKLHKHHDSIFHVLTVGKRIFHVQW